VAGEADLHVLAGDAILSASFLFHYQSFQRTCHPHVPEPVEAINSWLAGGGISRITTVWSRYILIPLRIDYASVEAIDGRHGSAVR